MFGFESNLNKNIIRKREKYKNLIKDLKSDYSSVKFINLSMSSLGVLFVECSTFQDMLNDIGIDEKQQRYIIRKMINFALELLITYFAAEIRIGIIQNYWNNNANIKGMWIQKSYCKSFIGWLLVIR